MAQFKIGVVGTGYWGKNHVRVYKELKDEGVIDDVIIYDRDNSKSEVLAKQFGVTPAKALSEITNDESIRGVSVVTPSVTHFKVASALIEAGKDVLVEKPLTLNTKEAQDLARLAEDRKRIVMCGHIFRFHPAVTELKKFIDEGQLGKLNFLLGQRLDWHAPRTDTGVIFTLGVHEVDLFCWLLGRYPKSVSVVSNSFYQEGIEEMATISLDFGDVKAYAVSSWLIPGGKRRELIVVGSEGVAKIDYLDHSKFMIHDSKMKRVETQNGNYFEAIAGEGRAIPVKQSEPLKNELRHFIECVKTRKPPLVNADAAARAVEICEAALRSARERKTIELTDGN